MGFFGFTPRWGEVAAQPLHTEQVDIDRAIAVTDEAVGLYLRARAFPNAPPFSGGVLDAWPNWAVQAFTVLQQEEARVTAWARAEAQRQEHGHG